MLLWFGLLRNTQGLLGILFLGAICLSVTIRITAYVCELTEIKQRN
ncbi:MAG: hypothetical protein HY363_02415 [Candidatus Aenigmarchaeota archaeon]|nr:hypothetical protein [Candidatus Aenigmarchaeota archaeon]